MTYYVKSLDSDHTTKTLQGDVKVICQTLDEIVRTKTLKPNTKSFGHKKRLSTTILHENYLKSYRPQGIIFTTRKVPDYILPFDLILAAQSDNIVIHYYQMRDNLHKFYNHVLIPGYERFIFKNIQELVEKFPTPRDAWNEICDFRNSNGQKKLAKQKFRLCEYNEAIFTESIHIDPVAIFGYRKETRELARKLKMPYYRSAREFMSRNKE